MSDDILKFVALGGLGEIGKNAYLYGYKGKWLLVDLGLAFADELLPGVEIVLPDVDFIEKQAKDLVGILVTHAHEDHLGAIPYLWERLQCPIYASPFATSILKNKLSETKSKPKFKTVKAGERYDIGPFDVECIPMTHSTPEAMALAIRTEMGIVFHSGDWKFDDTPVIGSPPPYERLQELGEEGVLALMGDSTNAQQQGESGSEGSILKPLQDIFARHRDGRVVVTCFSSNIERLQTIATAAQSVGRDVGMVGRSLSTMEKAARQNGYLQDVDPFLTADEAAMIPHEQLVLIATGCQGEPRAALTRLAYDSHPALRLEPSDLVIYSSSSIPGNEKAIGRVRNQLARYGIHVMAAEEGVPVHVTGHATAPEMVRLLHHLKPKFVVPIHGEVMHQQAHAELAQQEVGAQALVLENGQLIELGPQGMVADVHIPAPALVMDGDIPLVADDFVIKQRKRITWNGAATISVLISDANLADCRLSLFGIIDPEEQGDVLADAEDAVYHALERLSRKELANDERVEKTAKTALRQVIRQDFGKKPVTSVHILRA